MTTGACSGGQEPGTPLPGSSIVTTTTSATSTAAGRPAALPLHGVSPCELVTDDMRQRFKIDRPTPAPREIVPNEPSCTFITSTIGQYLVTVVRDKGIEALGRPVTASVGGFPAVPIKDAVLGVGHLSIDVADGQRLDVEVQRPGSNQPIDEIYRDTQAFAGAVLATLRQKLGR